MGSPVQAQSVRFGQGATYADIIKNDHQAIEQLLGRLRESQDPQETEDMFKQLQDGLGKHMEAEEKYLYPELEKNPTTKMLAVKARDEHSAAKIELKKVDPKAERDVYLGRLDVLSSLIKSHVSFEENQLLPMAQNVVDSQTVTENFRKVY